MSSHNLQLLYLKTVVSIEEDGILRPAGVANEDLRSELLSRGLNPCRAVGADPDSDHAEESWAIVGLSDEEACALGAAFGQVAVFRLTSAGQMVLACFENWVASRPW
jgi:hypothetical protein